MSHGSALVFLPNTPLPELGDDPRRTLKLLEHEPLRVLPQLGPLLAPYDEGTTDPRFRKWAEDADAEGGGYYVNPNAKYDYWLIGGRFGAKLHTATEAAGILLEPSTVWGTHTQRERMRKDIAQSPRDADIALAEDLDWKWAEGCRDARLYEFWRDWLDLREGRRVFDAFTGPEHVASNLGLRQIVGDDEICDRREVPDGWVARPFFEDGDPRNDGDRRRRWQRIFSPISWSEFERECADYFHPFRTYAQVDAAGWHEGGRLGWFGTNHGTGETHRSYARSALGRLREAAPDTLLVVLDYHI